MPTTLLLISYQCYDYFEIYVNILTFKAFVEFQNSKKAFLLVYLYRLKTSLNIKIYSPLFKTMNKTDESFSKFIFYASFHEPILPHQFVVTDFWVLEKIHKWFAVIKNILLTMNIRSEKLLTIKSRSVMFYLSQFVLLH